MPIPRASALPKEVEAELRDMAARLDLDMKATVQALVEVVAGIHGRFGDGDRPAA